MIYLGSCLSDKIPLDIYQKHRDGEEGWLWKTNKNKIKFRIKKLQDGNKHNKVSIIFSVSGKIEIRDLPQKAIKNSFVYEILPDKNIPNRSLLISKEDQMSFRSEYQKLLRMVERKHKNAKKVNIFPAIPLSVAIICGRELMKDISPALRVYDVDKKKYKFIMEVKKI